MTIAKTGHAKKTICIMEEQSFKFLYFKEENKMNDFQFQNTTKVYFGKDQLGHLHEEVLKHGKNVLVVYGGGSTIDASKAIAALTLTDTDDFWDLVEKKVSCKDALPVIAMPTIASIGSEMDKSCVIANVDKNVKSGINGDILRLKQPF